MKKQCLREIKKKKLFKIHDYYVDENMAHNN